MSATTSVACIGMGFVGYKTALAFCRSGYDVTGVDTDEELVTAIRNGTSPFESNKLEAYIADDSCQVTTRILESAACDVYIISVPTPLDENNTPDLSYIRSACRDVAMVMDENDLVVIQSTVYPGAITDVLIPELERFGLEAGADFGVSHVPERYSPGDEESMSATRVIGSLNDTWHDVTAELYEDIAQSTFPVSTIKTAETIKLVENTQRDVNIALMNEFAYALNALDVDVWEVLEGAGTKWNFHYYEPGLGVGGHCLPIDPHYFISAVEDAGRELHLVPTAREINDLTPKHHVSRIVTALDRIGKDPSSVDVAVLGITYKSNVKDVRNSPALELVQHLKGENLTVNVFDPEFESGEEIVSTGITNGSNIESTARESDVLVVGAGHDYFENVDPRALASIMADDPIVFDPQRTLNADAIDRSELTRLQDIGWHRSDQPRNYGTAQDWPRDQAVGGGNDD